MSVSVDQKKQETRICGQNTPIWYVADIGISMADAIPVGIHYQWPPDQRLHVEQEDLIQILQIEVSFSSMRMVDFEIIFCLFACFESNGNKYFGH